MSGGGMEESIKRGLDEASDGLTRRRDDLLSEGDAAEAWLDQLDPAIADSVPACKVEWSEEDGEYVGRSALYPSLSWLAPTRDGAMEGIRRLVAETDADLHNAFDRYYTSEADRLRRARIKRRPRA